MTATPTPTHTTVASLLTTLRTVHMRPSESLLVLALGGMVTLNAKLLPNGKLKFLIQWPLVGGEDECRTFNYSPRDPDSFTDADFSELLADAPILASDKRAYNLEVRAVGYETTALRVGARNRVEAEASHKREAFAKFANHNAISMGDAKGFGSLTVSPVIRGR